LAKAVPTAVLKSRFAEPDEEQVRRFHLTVAEFADTWLGRGDADNLDTAIALYFDPEFEKMRDKWTNEGEDIGTTAFAHMTPVELQVFLGLIDSLPLTFRKFTADDPSVIVDGDQPFPGGVPVELSWHQLGFVHFLFSQLAAGRLASEANIHHTQEGLDQAPIAIQEEWGKVSGMCLFDGVGLGKTLSCLAAIGTLQNVHIIQQAVLNEQSASKRKELEAKLPACVRNSEYSYTALI
jgi:hypothetical protein